MMSILCCDWDFMMINSKSIEDEVKFRLVQYRIRLFPKLISKWNELLPELPLNVLEERWEGQTHSSLLKEIYAVLSLGQKFYCQWLGNECLPKFGIQIVSWWVVHFQVIWFLIWKCQCKMILERLIYEARSMRSLSVQCLRELYMNQGHYELSSCSNHQTHHKMNGFSKDFVRRHQNKLGCVVRIVVDTILPHAECGQNDHRKDAPPFTKN